MKIVDLISDMFGWIIVGFFSLSAIALFIVFPIFWLIALLFGIDPFR
ncbi:MAG: hypothetical protein LBN20_04335 [Endomicrobium sp.]|jgi:hypothetical protein|nr:hypothetical protein [Endomicrobium sp.]